MRETKGFLPHIEGLRAIAIVSVVIYHIERSWLPGGYLGVDIFFVISGFVITRSLLRRQGSASTWTGLAAFYIRRIKRLLPVLALIVVTAIILIRLVAPWPEFINRTGITAMFGVSNIQLFLANTDYFGENNNLNPLMHTWALGIEEQFYLVYPLLCFWAMRRPDGGRSLLTVIFGVATVLSFLGFALLFHTHQSAVYYLMPFRAWELGVGCLLALYVRALDSRTSLVVQTLAFLGIIVAFVVGYRSPVIASFLAVGGSAGLILTGAKESALNRVMLASPLQYLGRLSYSIYLWHWVIIGLTIWTVGLNWISIPAIVIATLGLASLSFHVLEEPARHRPWFSLPSLNLAAGLIIMISVAALILIMNKVNVPPFTGTMNAVVARTGYIPGGSLVLDSKRLIIDCAGVRIANDPEAASRAIEACQAESPTGPRLVFFGDSLSYDMFGASEVLFREKVATVINFGQNGCRAPRRASEPKFCDYPDTVMAAMPPLAKDQRGYVVLRSNYNPLSLDGSLGRYAQRIESFYERMNQFGYGVIYVAAAPSFPLLTVGGLCTEQWFRPAWALSENCGADSSVSRSEQLELRKDFYNALKKLEKQYLNFHVFDPFDALCGPDKDICKATRNGVPLYRDPTHLTTAGGEVMGQAFLDFLRVKGMIP
jgi:peptidoglycan/LPS O-acetylase OafA/YrhL